MVELVRQHLKPLEKYLRMKDITDICINKAGEVWVDRQNGGWICYQDANIKTRDLLMLFDVIATIRDQKFSDIHPVLSSTLPFYEYRVEVQHPTILAGKDIGVSIRTSKLKDNLTLEDVFPTGEDDMRERPPKHENQDFILEQTRKHIAKGEHAQAVRLLIANRKCILVAGGTSTGKTTTLNLMLKCVDMDRRIVSIEDAQELKVRQKNWLGFVKSKSGTDIAQMHYGTIVDSCLRCRPDCIIFGELDNKNTMPFLVLANSGHEGGFATVHANTAKAALKAVVGKVKMAGSDLNPETIEEYVRTGVYAVAYLDAWIGRDGRKKKMGVLELLQ